VTKRIPEAEPWGEGEPCTCGHRWSEHADRIAYGRPLTCEGRCTVCTCNRFDWDINAPTSGARGNDRHE
jgi:hypothetical protein